MAQAASRVCSMLIGQMQATLPPLPVPNARHKKMEQPPTVDLSYNFALVDPTASQPEGYDLAAFPGQVGAPPVHVAAEA
eukprot:6318568-Prymnesium_polylepis.1